MRISIKTVLIGATALTMFEIALPQLAAAQADQAAPAPAAQPPETQPVETAAADVAADAAADDIGTITVTARRRDESIVDVPLAITVVSSSALEKLDITNTAQLANFVPGLQFSDFTPGNSRNDRGGNRPLIFRGLNIARNGGVTQAGSMFLDGAAVIGNEIPAGMDIGAVEVLRGPQNVYFGRASMTGAVSYRTKAIPKTWQGQIDVTVAERDTHRIEASIAGPVVPDILGIRLTGLDESNDGYVRNDFNNGASPKLGSRSRQSVSATVDFTPTERLEVKLYGNYFEDEDGASATANIFPDATINPATGMVTALGSVTNCLRGIAVGAGINQQARPTICGKVPSRSAAINFVNTNIPARDAAFIFGIPFLQNDNFKQQVGLQRQALNTHGVINYTISDFLKFQSITGYHTNVVQQVGDGIQQPVRPGATYSVYTYNLANQFRDFSEEVRLSTDPERALSFTAGANYVNARNLSTAVVTFTSNPTPTAAAPNPVPTFTPFPQNISDDRAKTYGFFGGAYLKLLDKRLTLSAEARYQIDKRRTLTTNALGVRLSDLNKDFKSFNPRVSIDFDVGGRRKIYASYATGSRPGGFNGGLLVYLDPTNPIYTRTTPPPFNFQTVTTDIANTFGPVDISFDEERLKIGELGLKGNFGDGKGYFDINAYYGKLTGQQVNRSLIVNSLGFALGAVQNTGETEIYGVEFTGNFNFTRDLSLNTTFAWNHTNRTKYIDNSPGTLQINGFADFSGLDLPNTPEYSGSAVLSYDRASDDDRWTPFGTAALVYRGKQFADIGNFAYIPDRATLDLRAGMHNESFRVEVFVTNVTDNRTYPGGNVAPDFGGNPRGQYSGFFGAYAEPRTFGGRFSASF